MTFRKFGTSDDQKVSLDREDEEGLRKSSSVRWDEDDAKELQRENEK